MKDKTEVLRNSNSSTAGIFQKVEKIKYELAIFTFLTIVFLPTYNKITDDIYASLLFLDYRAGFGPRLFLGSLLSFFSLSKSSLLVEGLVTTFGIILILFASLLSGNLIRNAGEAKEVTIYFGLVFLSLPYTASAFNHRLSFFDRSLIFFTLLSLVSLQNKKARWLIPPVLLMALLTDHFFIFLYLPVIAILILHEVYKGSFSFKIISLALVGFAVVFVISAYFLLTSHELDKLTESLGSLKTFAFYKQWLAYVLYVSPIFTMFFLIWGRAAKNSDKKFEKFIFSLCLFLPLSGLPVFLFLSNSFRLKAALLIGQFFLLFYFLHVKNEALSNSVEKTAIYLKNHKYLSLALLAYSAATFFAFKTGYLWDLILGPLSTRLL